jgi:superfamily II helicase
VTERQYLSTLRELDLQQVAPRLLEVLRRQGLANLTKFQKEATENGITRGTSQILVTHDYDEAYTIAEIALLNRVASDYRARALVLCPNPHQAEKKFQSLSQKCKRLGIEATQLIRRRRASRTGSRTGRVIVATYRSFDIASRADPDTMEGIACVLIDRLDLIGEPELGARLETALVTLLGLPNVQYIVICPPLENIIELCNWLKADPVRDRKEDMKRIFSVRAFEDINDSLADLTQFVHRRSGQVMILCANIQACEDLASQLSGTDQKPGPSVLDLRLEPNHRDDLRRLANSILKKYQQSRLTVRLSQMVSRGVAFFHEGVSTSQRREITAAWEEGLLPVIIIPIRFAIASGLRASLVFIIGVFMQEFGKELSHEDTVTMLSEWQLSSVLGAAGRRGVDNEAFGIVVVDSEQERTRVLAKYFYKDKNGDLQPIQGEVDSTMDEAENIQDLVLMQLCGKQEKKDDPFSVINRTFWGSSSQVVDVRAIGTNELDDTSVESLLLLRSTRSTYSRSLEIPDESVKLVSVRPDKIEGLVHSGSREIWHYITLRSREGVSCSCESWKFQGIRKHRLCKHLVKFATYAMKQNETKAYAAGVIKQALRGLEVFGELEIDGLITRDGKSIRCTPLGENVSLLGVPVKDAKKVMRALSDKRSDLKAILKNVMQARADLLESVANHVLNRLPAGSIDDMIDENTMPGILENCIEELEYVNFILLSLMDEKHVLRRQSEEMESNLLAILDSRR